MKTKSHKKLGKKQNNIKEQCKTKTSQINENAKIQNKLAEKNTKWKCKKKIKKITKQKSKNRTKNKTNSSTNSTKTNENIHKKKLTN